MGGEQMKNIFAKMPGKSGRRKWGIIGAAAVILITIIAGVSIYNTPDNRLARLLDLGYRYLEEGNYEQAVIAFDKAIAIDDKCMESYAGGIKSYQGIDDEEALADIYERALNAALGLGESELTESMDMVVEIYLAADDVYSGNPEKVVQVLEVGLNLTQDDRIADLLMAQDGYNGKGESGNGYQDKVNTDNMPTLSDSAEEQAKTGENGNWVDDLYQKMISGDIEAVYDIILDSGFIEKCSEYEHEEVYNSTEYGLLTSEGKIIVIKDLKDGEYKYLCALYCVHEDEPRMWLFPNTASGGDYYYECRSDVDYYNDKSWLIGNNCHWGNVNGGDSILPYGEPMIIFN